MKKLALILTLLFVSCITETQTEYITDTQYVTDTLTVTDTLREIDTVTYSGVDTLVIDRIDTIFDFDTITIIDPNNETDTIYHIDTVMTGDTVWVDPNQLTPTRTLRNMLLYYNGRVKSGTAMFYNLTDINNVRGGNKYWESNALTIYGATYLPQNEWYTNASITASQWNSSTQLGIYDMATYTLNDDSLSMEFVATSSKYRTLNTSTNLLSDTWTFDNSLPSIDGTIRMINDSTLMFNNKLYVGCTQQHTILQIKGCWQP